MNAGSLNFTLGADPREYLAGIDAATKANIRLTTSVDGINAAFARNAKTTAITATELKSASKALGASLSSLTMTASLFAGPQVASTLYPLMFLGKELKGVAASMKLIGISAPVAAGAMGLFAAAAATTTVAVLKFNEANAAMKLEHETAVQWNERRFELWTKLEGQAKALSAEGGFDPERLRSLKRKWLRGSEGDMNAALGELQRDLRGKVPMLPEQQDSLLNYTKFKTLLGGQALGGDFEKRAQIEIETADKIQKAFKIATESGQSFEQLRDLIMAGKTRQLAELDAAKTPKPAPESLHSLSPVTNLERMGAVFSGLGRGFGQDHARATADNTRRTVGLLTEIKSQLSPAAANSFANQ